MCRMRVSLCPLRLAWLSVAFGTLTTGCYLNAIDDISELDAIATLRDPGREYGDLRTFAMREEVADLSELADDPIDVDHEYDTVIVRGIARNLAELGWTRTDDAEAADVIVLNGIVAADNWVYYSYWWDYYPYYIYYPTYTTAINFATGSLITTMVKPDEMESSDGQDVVPAIWFAGSRGLIGSSGRSSEERINDVIDQSFRQSDYLRVGDPVPPIYGIGIDGPIGEGDETGGDETGGGE